jgi:hypothetical protein
MAGALVTTNILQTLVAMGLGALRERIVLARIANREYEGQLTGRPRGATVNIVIPAAITARVVAPDVVPPAVTAVTPTTKSLTLDQWYEAPFAMDDKGITQVEQGIMPTQATEAIKAMANNIDQYLWTLVHGASGFYGYTGVAATTPFATDLAEFLAARALADAQLMPDDPEKVYVILNTLAKANAMGTTAMQNASWRGDANAFKSGKMGQVLGANWDYSQNVPSHTAGTWTNAGTTTGTNAAGQGVVNLTGGTGSILVGDVVTFAGDLQTYVVTAVTGTAPTTAITVAPNLVTAKSATEVVTVKATHRCNLLIHSDAIGFAMAPLVETASVAGVPVAQAVAIDEQSGLALRLEVTRQHRQYQWAFDALYGGVVVRREYGVRIAG